MKRSVIVFLIVGFCIATSVSYAQLTSNISRQFKADIVARMLIITKRVALSPQRQYELGRYLKKQDSLANAALSHGVPVDEVNIYYNNDLAKLKEFLTPFEQVEYETQNDKTGSKFAVAIKHRVELGLNKKQIDTLLKDFTISGSLRRNQDFDIKKYEAQELLKILGKEKFADLLSFVNKVEITKYAHADWDQLAKYGLDKGLDSIKVLQEFLKYENSKTVRAEFQRNTGQKSAEAPLKRPVLILKIDAFNNKLPVSEFTYVIQYRDAIKLSTIQIDTLLDKILKLEVLRANYKSEMTEGKYVAKPYEYEQLLKILTPEQFETYFLSKNKNKSIANATKTFEKLRKLELISGVDTIKAKSDIQQYELKKLVASEYYAFSKTQENVFRRKEVEDNKPDILKKLDSVTKQSTASTQQKQSLAW